MMSEWNDILEEPEEFQTLLIKIGQTNYHGVKKGSKYYKIEPVRSQPCNCVTHHVLKFIAKPSILLWSYPKDKERLNIIYEDIIGKI